MKSNGNFKIICLLTMLRGGSKLLHSLLDNHSQVVCFPRTFQYSVFWNKIKNDAQNHESIASAFVDSYPRFFSGKEWYRYNRYDKADCLGVNQDETFSVEPPLFKKFFCELMSKSDSDRKQIFLNLHFAFHLATHKPLPEKGVILYHVHTHDLYDDIDLCIQDFPTTTQLFLCLRHPLQGIRSCLNWTNMHNSFGAGQMFHYQTNIYEMGYILNKKYPQNKLRIIPLEQVKKNPKELMSRLALELGINWEDSLLESTIQGKLWYGNTLKPHKGISKQTTAFTPRNFLEKKDWEVLSYFYSERLSKYAYSPISLPKNFLNNIFYTLKILMPTTIEYEAFVQSLKPSHYYSLVKMTHEEIIDPRLAHFDYARKRNIDRKTFSYRMGTYLFRIRLANPLPFFYYYPKRVLYMLKFFKNYQAELEPPLILDK